MAMFQMENQFTKRSRSSEPLLNRRTQCKTENGDFRAVDGRHQLIKVDNDGSSVKHWDENQNPRYSDKAKLCWKFMNGEKCQFGDKCHFNHIRSERKSVAISIVNIAGNGNGNGNGNVQMQKQHNKHKQTPWKTRLCNRWMLTGSCGFGLKCCFAHGESELRQRGLNDARDHAEGEPCKLVDMNCEKKVDGKRWEFKWKDVEKIGRIYADWINDTSLVHIENGNVAS